MPHFGNYIKGKEIKLGDFGIVYGLKTYGRSQIKNGDHVRLILFFGKYMGLFQDSKKRLFLVPFDYIKEIQTEDKHKVPSVSG